MTEQVTTWVDAAPFRAHLRFLMAAGRLSADEVAAVAGLSGLATAHLLNGQRGRAVRRISAEVAYRLLAVSAGDVRGLAWQLVPAATARRQLARLRSGGRTDADIARLARVSAADLADLNGPGEHCGALLTIRLTATVRRLNRRHLDASTLAAA